MRRTYLHLLLAIIAVLLCFSVTGVYATWTYYATVEEVESDISMSITEFKYPDLYIVSAVLDEAKSSCDGVIVNTYSATEWTSTIDLGSSSTAVAVFDVTIKNQSEYDYYFNKAETLSSSNSNIIYSLSGIATKDLLAAGEYVTFEVTFEYDTDTVSITELASVINFNFVLYPDSINYYITQTALERFEDILNNSFDLTVGEVDYDPYTYLDMMMDSRSGYNKESAVTYIGNVSGANTQDSQAIEALFGDEFMNMDLDGDGSPEPITMLIKRENIDGYETTGDTYYYTYTDNNGTWWNTSDDFEVSEAVNGVEMTIYITTQDFNELTSDTVVVYAASYTILPGTTEWICLVPLTEGTAPANNYEGWGSDNSFNTDYWMSVATETAPSKSIETLASEAIAELLAQ